MAPWGGLTHLEAAHGLGVVPGRGGTARFVEGEGLAEILQPLEFGHRLQLAVVDLRGRDGLGSAPCPVQILPPAPSWGFSPPQPRLLLNLCPFPGFILIPVPLSFILIPVPSPSSSPCLTPFPPHPHSHPHSFIAVLVLTHPLHPPCPQRVSIPVLSHPCLCPQPSLSPFQCRSQARAHL